MIRNIIVDFCEKSKHEWQLYRYLKTFPTYADIQIRTWTYIICLNSFINLGSLFRIECQWPPCIDWHPLKAFKLGINHTYQHMGQHKRLYFTSPLKNPNDLCWDWTHILWGEWAVTLTSTPPVPAVWTKFIHMIKNNIKLSCRFSTWILISILNDYSNTVSKRLWFTCDSGPACRAHL